MSGYELEPAHLLVAWPVRILFQVTVEAEVKGVQHCLYISIREM